jgi:hypothetical protein
MSKRVKTPPWVCILHGFASSVLLLWLLPQDAVYSLPNGCTSGVIFVLLSACFDIGTLHLIVAKNLHSCEGI